MAQKLTEDRLMAIWDWLIAKLESASGYKGLDQPNDFSSREDFAGFCGVVNDEDDDEDERAEKMQNFLVKYFTCFFTGFDDSLRVNYPQNPNVFLTFTVRMFCENDTVNEDVNTSRDFAKEIVKLKNKFQTSRTKPDDELVKHEPLVNTERVTQNVIAELVPGAKGQTVGFSIKVEVC